MSKSKGYHTEAEFLKTYNIKEFDVPLVTVDVVVLTIHQKQLKVLLTKRPDFPAKGQWALAGGFIDLKHDANLEATAFRKLTEKTQLTTPYLEQLGTFGNDTRDPRGWSVTTVYYALIPYVDLPTAVLTSQHGYSQWHDVNDLAPLNLAFDHAELIEKTLERVRSKVLYTLIPAYLIDSPFTLTELQRAYELIMQKPLEKKSFRRRLETAEVLEDTQQMTSEGSGRPASLYILKHPDFAFNFNRQLQG